MILKSLAQQKPGQERQIQRFRSVNVEFGKQLNQTHYGEISKSGTSAKMGQTSLVLL